MPESSEQDVFKNFFGKLGAVFTSLNNSDLKIRFTGVQGIPSKPVIEYLSICRGWQNNPYYILYRFSDPNNLNRFINEYNDILKLSKETNPDYKNLCKLCKNFIDNFYSLYHDLVDASVYQPAGDLFKQSVNDSFLDQHFTRANSSLNYWQKTKFYLRNESDYPSWFSVKEINEMLKIFPEIYLLKSKFKDKQVEQENEIEKEKDRVAAEEAKQLTQEKRAKLFKDYGWLNSMSLDEIFKLKDEILRLHNADAILHPELHKRVYNDKYGIHVQEFYCTCGLEYKSDSSG